MRHFILGLVLSLSGQSFGQAEDIVYVRLPAHVLTQEFVRQTDFNRDHVRDDFYAFGYVKRSALEALPASLAGDVLELDAKFLARHAFDPKTLEVKDDFAPDSAGPYEDYHDYEALTDELQRLASEHPDIARLESAGKSAQNRELWLLKLSDNVESDEDEPKLLYIANMHGDEVAGRELVLYFARMLAAGYGNDQRLTKLLKNAQVYLMPSMNPDGFELGQRYNARGVDLNRDFPDFTADPNDTPAGRAPETQAIMALHQRHHFVMALNYHGGEVCFNVPWDTKANRTTSERFGDDPLMQLTGRQYADQNATMRGNDGGSFDRGLTYGYEWYEVDGGMQDWSIYYRQSIHATVELSYTKWPNASNLAGLWAENKESMLKYLEAGIFGMHLKVVDGSGNVLSPVTVRVGTLNRDVTYPTGLVHRPALAGSQTVRVSSPGFAAKDVTLTPSAFDGTNSQTVTLSRR